RHARGHHGRLTRIRLMQGMPVFAQRTPHVSGRSAAIARRYGVALQNRDPRTLVLTTLVLALVGEVAAFAHLVEDYLTGDPIVRWDVRLATWLHVHAATPLVRLFEVVTYAGNAVVLGVLVLTAAFVLVRRRRLNDAALLLVAFGGAEVLN